MEKTLLTVDCIESWECITFPGNMYINKKLILEICADRIFQVYRKILFTQREFKTHSTRLSI